SGPGVVRDGPNQGPKRKSLILLVAHGPTKIKNIERTTLSQATRAPVIYTLAACRVDWSLEPVGPPEPAYAIPSRGSWASANKRQGPFVWNGSEMSGANRWGTFRLTMS